MIAFLSPAAFSSLLCLSVGLSVYLSVCLYVSQSPLSSQRDRLGIASWLS